MCFSMYTGWVSSSSSLTFGIILSLEGQFEHGFSGVDVQSAHLAFTIQTKQRSALDYRGRFEEGERRGGMRERAKHKTCLLTIGIESKEKGNVLVLVLPLVTYTGASNPLTIPRSPFNNRYFT